MPNQSSFFSPDFGHPFSFFAHPSSSEGASLSFFVDTFVVVKTKRPEPVQTHAEKAPLFFF